MTSERAGLKEYRIDRIKPIELPRDENLIFYRNLWRKYGSLGSVDKKQVPMVEEHEGALYAANGNQRMIWRLLNGIETVRAVKVDRGDGPVFSKISEDLRVSRGIKSFRDLVTVIPFPERYRIN